MAYVYGITSDYGTPSVYGVCTCCVYAWEPARHAQQANEKVPVVGCDLHVPEEVSSRITCEQQCLGCLHMTQVGKKAADERPR